MLFDLNSFLEKAERLAYEIKSRGQNKDWLISSFIGDNRPFLIDINPDYALGNYVMVFSYSCIRGKKI